MLSDHDAYASIFRHKHMIGSRLLRLFTWERAHFIIFHNSFFFSFLSIPPLSNKQTQQKETESHPSRKSMTVQPVTTMEGLGTHWLSVEPGNRLGLAALSLTTDSHKISKGKE